MAFYEEALSCHEYRRLIAGPLRFTTARLRVAMCRHVVDCRSCWEETCRQADRAERAIGALTPAQKRALDGLVEETVAGLEGILLCYRRDCVSPVQGSQCALGHEQPPY